MPVRTTKPLAPDQVLAYKLVAAFKKFIDPGLGFRSIEMVPLEGTAVQFGNVFSVPASPDPDESRTFRVDVRENKVRLEFRRGRRTKTQTFEVSDPEFERVVAEFVGKYWDCYFSTYWMGL